MTATIIQGDCTEVIPELDEEIDLTFTSPPYYNAIDYEGDVDESVDHWTKTDEDYSDWMALMEDCFEAIYEKTRDDGYCAINISFLREDGDRLNLPGDITNLMEKIGWNFVMDITWDKVIATGRRSGVLIQNPYPGYYYPDDVTEFVLVFKKGEGSPDDWVQNPIWSIRCLSPQESDHPAPFPVELADRVLEEYSAEGDIVLDPFLGSGTTAVSCVENDRDCIGVEMLEGYIEIAEERLHEAKQPTLDDY